ncbi:MAG: ROK family glucokinase [Actinobacteria bacterium]|nr:ROK family glucokinase [Actinomycetota bacterium]
MNNDQYLIGLDVGGTKISAILVDETLSIISELRKQTLLISGRAIVDEAKELIAELLSGNDLDIVDIVAIGIGVAGMINFKEGEVVFSPNLPLKNVAFKKLMEDHFGVPVFLDNDANVAAFGEKYLGSGRGVSNFICVTIGTGIGGGIFINDKIYRGVSGSSAEVGHMVIDINGPKCGCGNYGCFETLASGQAIVRMAKEAIAGGKKTLILDFAKGNIENVNGEVVSRAASDNDQIACDILDKIGRFIGIGLTNIVNIFNPEKITLTGGVSQSGSLILNPAKEVVSQVALVPNSLDVKIELAELGNRAGVLGAAALALRELSS